MGIVEKKKWIVSNGNHEEKLAGQSTGKVVLKMRKQRTLLLSVASVANVYSVC